MPNAIFVCHLVLFLPHRRPPPALVCRHCSTPSSSVAIAVRGSRLKPSQSSSPICCLRHLLLLSLVAVVSRRRPPSLNRPPPPPPLFLVIDRHHRHLLSTVAAPLVAGAVAHQLQSLVSATVTSKHPDKQWDWTAADGWQREINGEAQSMDGGGGGGNGHRRASRWEMAAAVGDGNGGSGAMEGETVARSQCAA